MSIEIAQANGAPCVTDTSVPGLITVTCSGPIDTTADDDAGVVVSDQGADGVSASNGEAGDKIAITSSSTITTSGANSAGIRASSTGGSGVDGSFGGGSGGAGGDIAVISTGTITTSNDGAHGISVLSLGGPGGNAILPQGGGGSGGAGGKIEVTSSAAILTTGAAAHGILAESLGGDRGTGDPNGLRGLAGDIIMTISAGITASGDGSYAVFARSGKDVSGQALGQDVSITIDAGATLSGGTGLGGAVFVRSGVSAVVTNSGTVIGNVRMSADLTEFNNQASGLFESGETVDLTPTGALYNGVLNNLGTVSPGGDATVVTTALTGDFVQGASGTFKVDADWTGNAGAGLADRLAISGTAALDGTVEVNPINFPTPAGATKTFTILTAAGGVTDNGLTVTDTAAVNYTLLFPDANTVALQALINFLGSGGLGTGLTANQTAVGEALNSIVDNGETLGFLPELMSQPTQQELADGLDQLAPLGDGAAFASALATGETFAQQLLSCRVNGDPADSGRFIREGQCLWVRATARHADSDGGASEVRFEETATFYAAGAQVDLGGPWRLGAGLGFETSDLQTSSNATSEGDRLHAGAVLKYNPGPWLLAAAITGGHGWFDNERQVAFGAFSGVATSDTEMSFITGRLTAAYLMGFGHWYAKPLVDVSVTHLQRDGYRERGAGGIALAVEGSDDTVVSVSPALEFGAELRLAEGGVARPFVRAGVTWLDTDDFATTASFADATADAPFTVSTSIDDIAADIGAGIDFLSTGGTVLRLEYDGRFGEDTDQHGGSLKVSMPF